ncbi:MAG TPA: BON domain-containing protein [Burkholderiales bacterium]|nr:BON domain-containing protein [Burkholderiales bacterium]
MKPHSMTYASRTLTLAAAGALALMLNACDSKPSSDNAARTLENLVENAGRDSGSMPPTPGSTGAPSPNMSGDAALAAKVKAALSTDPALRSMKVEVDAANGVITLTGTADTAAKSDQAATVALQVEGVHTVRNEMVVVKGS